MLKNFKTEINPTVEQKIKIDKTIGTCRYVYNFYLSHNKALYDEGKKFMTGKSFSVWLNREWMYSIHKVFQTSKRFSEVQKERQV